MKQPTQAEWNRLKQERAQAAAGPQEPLTALPDDPCSCPMITRRLRPRQRAQKGRQSTASEPRGCGHYPGPMCGSRCSGS